MRIKNEYIPTGEKHRRREELEAADIASAYFYVRKDENNKGSMLFCICFTFDRPEKGKDYLTLLFNEAEFVELKKGKILEGVTDNAIKAEMFEVP